MTVIPTVPNNIPPNAGPAILAMALKVCEKDIQYRHGLFSIPSIANNGGKRQCA
jgi:hypothetical protein